ncbi:hypothetical protein ACLOJK_022277 [Asimina triloba]
MLLPCGPRLGPLKGVVAPRFLFSRSGPPNLHELQHLAKVHHCTVSNVNPGSPCYVAPCSLMLRIDDPPRIMPVTCHAHAKALWIVRVCPNDRPASLPTYATSEGLTILHYDDYHGPQIIRVHYPGLPSHPEHHIAKKQMSGFGGVVSFEVAGDLMCTGKFVDALKIPYIAPSFGGPESFVDQPAIMDSPPERAQYGIKDNLIRFSFGTEDVEDLKSDILQALDAI